MKIGFSGSRRGMTKVQVQELRRLLEAHRPEEFHHGQSIGADAVAHGIAIEVGVPAIVVYPSTAEDLIAKDLPPSRDTLATYLPSRRPLSRNRSIVRAVDLLVAAPSSPQEQIRSGTWSTVRYARRHGNIEVILLPP
jgi:hypothetical protein